MAAKAEHKDGTVGGVLVGRKHRDGGIKIKNITTGEPIEAEGGEVIIMAEAVSASGKHDFNGKKMTNLEILSAINESSGGVAFYKNGGKIEGPVKCGCTGKHHIYNGEKLTDREILKRMSEGGMISREIKSGNDFELLTPEEVLVLESYKQFKPAFRKKNIGQAFSDNGYPYHEHLEKAEALIDQLKKIGFITSQNALSDQGKLALQKVKDKRGNYPFPSLPHDKETYNKWWLPYFESTEMAKGGMVLEAQALRAKKADLIILPEDLKGTNCSNCQFVHITDSAAGQGYCKHPEVDQPVTARMCCIYWDAPGTQRVWQHAEKSMQHGGEVSIQLPNDIIQLQTDALVDKSPFAKGGSISEIAKASPNIMIVRPSHGQAPEETRPQNIPQASIKTPKQQAAINQEITNLVKNKGTDSSLYSASEIALMKQYSGAGGLSKHGASGPRILDQFFTPMDICAKMWGLALQHGFNFNRTAICEPSVGTGNFLQFVPRDARVEVVAYEVDEISHSICKILFPRYDIRHGSFESIFFTGRRHIGLAGVTTFFDLVIGNPPYREYVSPFAKLGEKDATGALTFEMYFIMRGIDVLKPNGLLIYIIPNTFLSNDKKYNSFKTELAKKADLVDAYRLPNGVFDFTEVGTDIIVLRKKK